MVRRKDLTIVILFLLLFIRASVALDRVFTWTNSSGSGLWSDPNNWYGEWDDQTAAPGTVLGTGYARSYRDSFRGWESGAGVLTADGDYVFFEMYPGRSTSEADCEMVIPSGISVQVLREIKSGIDNNSFTLTIEGSLIVGDPNQIYYPPEWTWGNFTLVVQTDVNMDGGYLKCNAEFRIGSYDNTIEMVDSVLEVDRMRFDDGESSSYIDFDSNSQIRIYGSWPGNDSNIVNYQQWSKWNNWYDWALDHLFGEREAPFAHAWTNGGLIRANGDANDVEIEVVGQGIVLKLADCVRFTRKASLGIEDGNDFQIKVRLTKKSNVTITVDYAVSDLTTDDNDYTVGGSGTLTFEPGEQTKFISINIANDGEIESPVEQFKVRLFNLNNGGTNTTLGTSEHLHTIIDGSRTVYQVCFYGGSNANDGLSHKTAFKGIQKGLDTAASGEGVVVWPGVYLLPFLNDSIEFNNKNIVLTSVSPMDIEVVEKTILLGSVVFGGNEDANCALRGFNIKDLYYIGIIGNGTHAEISYCIISNADPGMPVISEVDGLISNCLITDNYDCECGDIDGTLYGCNGVIRNCTIANNNAVGLSEWDGGTITLENCIIYNNAYYQVELAGDSNLNISYSNIDGGTGGVSVLEGTVNWGLGNIDADPCFFDPSGGDYHLKSEGWRWNKSISQGSHWYNDLVSSRCIDAGNPGMSLGREALNLPEEDPNNDSGVNLRINMGAYGGMAGASMGPIGWSLRSDRNNDGVVDWDDLAGQCERWLEIGVQQPEDFNHDGVIDFGDFAILAGEWMELTTWAQ